MATQGDWAGEYVFVFPELRGYWGFYTSGGCDDILPFAEWVERRILDGGVQWLDEQADLETEREYFRMRPITASQFDPGRSVRSRLASLIHNLRGERADTEQAMRDWERRLMNESRDTDT